MSVPGKVFHHATERAQDVALRHKQFGIWQEYTWQEYADHSRWVALGLRSLGVGADDKVAVHSENRPEWVWADVGAQCLEAVTVGVYQTCPAAEVEYLLGHSEAKVLIAEDEEQLDKAVEVWEQLPHLEHIVVIDPRGVRILDDPRVLTFAELLDRGRTADDDDGGGIARDVAAIDPDRTAIIVYTSGTTGPPKGAMISHRNMHVASEAWELVMELDRHEEVLSYLPLCHIAERTISVSNAASAGYVVNFCEDLDSLNQDLAEVQPSFFLGVPRIWEKMLATVRIKGADATWLKRHLLDFWLDQGARLERRRQAGAYGPHHRLWYGLGWLLVYRPLRRLLGMGRVRVAFSGAAPIAPQVLETLRAIGIPVREGYAMTENTAVATFTPEDDIRLGSVGVALPNSEIRIADDGEILTRSEATFLGYFRNPEATAATVVDGWLHTGDVGYLDDGHLYITDRKKDIIITAAGKNISPSEIENRLKVSPYVREAIVIGDRRKYLTALVGIEGDTVGDWATRKRVPYTTYEDLTSKPEVRDLIGDVVTEANVEFAQVETIKYFELLPIELDHEDGQLTATQKVKRSAITDQFEDLIEGMYR
ncbi:MAG: AMP-binding protein [Actinobacteria bacterium]|nr:AMP-binding protein [Actinomycetota bacterium]MBL6925530.1 AMP-binding protein [Acidimicrobiia bacterium]